MTNAGFAAATVVMAVGSLLQGGIGFGMAMVAAPLLALIDPGLAPGPLLVGNVALTFLMARREWHAVRMPDLGWALTGRVAGIVAAVLLMGRLSPHGLDLFFGATVLFAVVLTALGLSFTLDRRTLTGAGLVSGITGTATGIGGPPMAIVYQNERGPMVRGTLSAYFTVGAVLSAIGLGFIGRFGWTEFVEGLALCPGVVIGFLLSRRFLPYMDARGLRPAILTLSGVSGAILILRRLL